MTKITLSNEDFKNIKIKISYDNKRIVVVDIPTTNEPPESPINNIYCLDNSDNVLWKIQAGEGNYEDDPFVWIKSMPDGTFKARRFFGKEYLVDKDTGVAEEIGWFK